MYICLESMLQYTNDVGWNSSKGRSINLSAKTLTLVGLNVQTPPRMYKPNGIA